MTPETLELPRALERKLAEGHPWVYRDHVPRGFRAESGSFVRLRAGAFTAYALYDAQSPLALRVYSRKGFPDRSWVGERIASALSARRRFVDDDTTAYRWIHGEGDGLPGIVVDRYGGYAVLTLDTDALEGLVPWVVEGLTGATPLDGIVRRPRGAGATVELLSGSAPPRDLIVRESGLSFLANVHAGQKTGLFLDQRENRAYVERIARRGRVLNLFAYTGGFSVYALRGGAAHVTSVDASADALDAARENFVQNGYDPRAHAFDVADVFDFLEEARKRGDRYDLVITDPPSFARNKTQVEGALRAYGKLHAAALEVTSRVYVASSCSSQVGPDAFRGTLAAGAERARAVLRIVHDAGHAADHPVLLGHPEGRYLKFVACAVDQNV